MKQTIRKIYVISMIGVLLAITLMNVMGEPFPVLKTGISPTPEIMKLPMKLYFIDPEQNLMYSENRSVTIYNNQLVTGIVDALKSGPKNKKLISPVDSLVKIESYKIDNKVCYINVNKSFLDNPTWNANDKKLIVSTIVNTLTELEQIQGVQFLIDGKVLSEIAGNQIEKGPYKRNESFVYKSKAQPIEVVMEFINSIQNERYDIAYELIDFKSKTETPYEIFTKQMAALSRKYQRYERKVMFTQKFSNKVEVYIRYEADMSNFAQSTVGFNESWEVVEEDQEYRVLLNLEE